MWFLNTEVTKGIKVTQMASLSSKTVVKDHRGDTKMGINKGVITLNLFAKTQISLNIRKYFMLRSIQVVAPGL